MAWRWRERRRIRNQLEGGPVPYRLIDEKDDVRLQGGDGIHGFADRKARADHLHVAVSFERPLQSLDYHQLRFADVYRDLCPRNSSEEGSAGYQRKLWYWVKNH